jgi:hypothetical protein
MLQVGESYSKGVNFIRRLFNINQSNEIVGAQTRESKIQ